MVSSLSLLGVPISAGAHHILVSMFSCFRLFVLRYFAYMTEPVLFWMAVSVECTSVTINSVSLLFRILSYAV